MAMKSRKKSTRGYAPHITKIILSVFLKIGIPIDLLLCGIVIKVTMEH